MKLVIDRVWFQFVLLVLAVGCATMSPEDLYFRDVQSHANVYVAPMPSPIRKIAILPFKAPTELIGQSVSDIFVTEMLRANRYELVERSQMAKVLSESELALAGVSAAKAAAVGQMLGAEGVVIGTVDEYATVAQSGHPYPSVGISVRMIDCASGKVMWSADLALVADAKKTTLPMESRLVAHEVVAGLYQNWHVQPQSASKSVAAAEGDAGGVAGETPVGSTSSASVNGQSVAVPICAPSEFKLSDLGLREVQITWSTPTDTALNYRIERASAEDGPFQALATVSASKEKYVDTGLQDSTTYFYRLVAIGANGGASTPSKAKESMTAPPPEPPPNIRATAPASRALRVNWDLSPSEGVVRYIVERAASIEGPFVKVGEVDKSIFEEGGTSKTDLRDSAKYFYRVSAVNRVGAHGVPSKLADVTTLPPPAPVAGLTAKGAEVRCVPLTWTASPEADVIRYDLYRRTDTNASFALLTSVKGRETTRYLDGGRDPGDLADLTTYEYTIRAVNAVTAESEPAESLKAITRDVPPVVTSLSAKQGEPRQVTITWMSSPDEKVVGYEIYRLSDGTNMIGEVSGRDIQTYTDRGEKRWFGNGNIGNLKDGTEYQYFVIAYNTAHARSQPSEVARAKTKIIPATPNMVTATTNLPKSVKISFRTNPEKDIAKYIVEAAASSNGKFKSIGIVETAAVDELWFTEEGLSDGLQRFYRVKAIDADTLESEWSEVVAGGTKPLPLPPADVQWKAENKELSWTASASIGISQYKIWKKGFLGAELLAATSKTVCSLEEDKIGKGAKILITAVDVDGLESERSQAIEIKIN